MNKLPKDIKYFKDKSCEPHIKIQFCGSLLGTKKHNFFLQLLDMDTLVKLEGQGEISNIKPSILSTLNIAS